MFGIFPSYVTDYQEHSQSSLYGDDYHFVKWLNMYDTNILSHTSIKLIETNDC